MPYILCSHSPPEPCHVLTSWKLCRAQDGLSIGLAASCLMCVVELYPFMTACCAMSMRWSSFLLALSCQLHRAMHAKHLRENILQLTDWHCCGAQPPWAFSLLHSPCRLPYNRACLKSERTVIGLRTCCL